MSVNIVEFEKAIKASDAVCEDIDSKVEEYRKSLEAKAKDASDAKGIQVKSLMDFFKKIDLNTIYDHEPDSVEIGENFIMATWDGFMCQMGPNSGESITVYHKAFTIPTGDLKKYLNGSGRNRYASGGGIIEIDEVDV